MGVMLNINSPIPTRIEPGPYRFRKGSASSLDNMLPPIPEEQCVGGNLCDYDSENYSQTTDPESKDLLTMSRIVNSIALSVYSKYSKIASRAKSAEAKPILANLMKQTKQAVPTSGSVTGCEMELIELLRTLGI